MCNVIAHAKEDSFLNEMALYIDILQYTIVLCRVKGNDFEAWLMKSMLSCNSSSNPVITTRRYNMDPIDKITSTIHNGFVATDVPDQTPNAICALLASFLVTMFAVRNHGHPYVPANRHNNSSRYF